MNPCLPIHHAWRSAALIFRIAVHGAVAATLSLSAHAQIPQPTAAAEAPLAAVPALPSAPRYSASELKQAFNYMDANRDGKISREEAAGFRGVAKNFDRADTNHDGFLSRDEFDAAMNYVKQP